MDLWRDVVRRAPADLRAAPAALLGFAAWLSGDGALAWCAVECALEAEPDYSLAGLLTQRWPEPCRRRPGSRSRGGADAVRR